jgi:hypothetical protein
MNVIPDVEKKVTPRRDGQLSPSRLRVTLE